jgi:hypothetical protein
VRLTTTIAALVVWGRPGHGLPLVGPTPLPVINSLCQGWQGRDSSCAIAFTCLMAQDQKPFSETRAALLIAAIAGIPGNTVGVFASPIVLYLLSLLLKKKNGKQPNRFIPWFLIGMIAVPLMNSSPSSEKTESNQASSPDPLEGFALSADFVPGVEGRSPEEVCNTTSENCQKWTFLSKKCEINMLQRELGYMGKQVLYCSEAQSLRQQVTGIDLSTAPGAYNF